MPKQQTRQPPASKRARNVTGEHDEQANGNAKGDGNVQQEAELRHGGMEKTVADVRQELTTAGCEWLATMEQTRHGKELYDHMSHMTTALEYEIDGSHECALRQTVAWRSAFFFEYKRNERPFGLPSPMPKYVVMMNMSGTRRIFFSSNPLMLHLLVMHVPLTRGRADAYVRSVKGMIDLVNKQRPTLSLLLTYSMPHQTGIDNLHWDIRTFERKGPGVVLDGQYAVYLGDPRVQKVADTGSLDSKDAPAPLSVIVAQMATDMTAIDLDVDTDADFNVAIEIATSKHVQKLERLLTMFKSERKSMMEQHTEETLKLRTELSEMQQSHSELYARRVGDVMSSQAVVEDMQRIVSERDRDIQRIIEDRNAWEACASDRDDMEARMKGTLLQHEDVCRHARVITRWATLVAYRVRAITRQEHTRFLKESATLSESVRRAEAYRTENDRTENKLQQATTRAQIAEAETQKHLEALNEMHRALDGKDHVREVDVAKIEKLTKELAAARKLVVAMTERGVRRDKMLWYTHGLCALKQRQALDKTEETEMKLSSAKRESVEIREVYLVLTETLKHLTTMNTDLEKKLKEATDEASKAIKDAKEAQEKADQERKASITEANKLRSDLERAKKKCAKKAVPAPLQPDEPAHPQSPGNHDESATAPTAAPVSAVPSIGVAVDGKVQIEIASDPMAAASTEASIHQLVELVKHLASRARSADKHEHTATQALMELNALKTMVSYTHPMTSQSHMYTAPPPPLPLPTAHAQPQPKSEQRSLAEGYIVPTHAYAPKSYQNRNYHHQQKQQQQWAQPRVGGNDGAQDSTS